MEEAPGQALSILEKDSAEICGKGERGMMGFRLLKTYAEEKLYIPHLSDTAMRKVVDYYDRHGTPAQRALAHYVLGRVYCDMRLSASAISSFKNVIDMREDDAYTSLYQYEAATWLATLYEGKRQWDDVLSMRVEAYCYAQRAGRLSSAIYALRDLECSFTSQGKGKLATPYYGDVSAMASQAGNACLYDMLEEERACAYRENGMIEDTRDSLSASETEEGGVAGSLAVRYAIRGFRYELRSMPDSALHFYRNSLSCGDLEFRHAIYADLALLCGRLGDYGESVKYRERYRESADSLAHANKAEYANLMDYVEKNFSADPAREEAMRQRDHWMVVAFFLFLLLVPLGVYVAYVSSKRKNELLLLHGWIEAYREKLKDSRNKDKEELDYMRERLTASSQAVTDMREERRKIVNQLSSYEKEVMALRQKLENLKVTELQRSECYRKFHDVKYRPQSQDFIDLQQVVDDVYDGFTSKLRKLCPMIREDELWVCCMLKIGMTPSEMCNALSCKLNNLSMMRKRLYKKLFGQEGSAADFDAFIRNL